MYKPVDKRTARLRRHRRIRRELGGTPQRPRLNVFRSTQHIYAQVIDDEHGRTLVACSTLDSGAGITSGTKAERARQVGLRLAERAREAGIGQVVFDRGGYRYHGRVKALADGAREGGLDF